MEKIKRGFLYARGARFISASTIAIEKNMTYVPNVVVCGLTGGNSGFLRENMISTRKMMIRVNIFGNPQKIRLNMYLVCDAAN